MGFQKRANQEFLIREVDPGYNRDWVPAWAKDMPILKIGDKDPPYTYSDWLEWPLVEGKMEILDGLLVTLAAPTPVHAGIEGNIYGLIWTYLRGKTDKVYSAPCAVRLFPNSDKIEDDMTVQPDIFVVHDITKFNNEGYQGAPDFIIEILSPSNRKQDVLVKFNTYQRAGVGEYWIVDPEAQTIQVNILEKGKYVVSMYGEDAKVPVASLPGLEIDFAEVFANAAIPGLDSGL
ncbi:MAG: Uma2 family endonuclease [Spirochaetaceae bacterium]|jgi:Uma2 family endonuclease|nr:Uma2 family endonuclease [Spirochaetaceae bacterium]